MSASIPYGRQDISAADIEAVVGVLRSDFLTQGPVIPAFERAVAAQCGAGRAIAMNSATSALHAACLALDLGPGDRLWTSPNTFVASANCALYCGAEVDFVDIDPHTYNMSVEALEDRLIEADKAGKLPKIVVPVHFAGQSCEMKRIRALADHYGFRIIEDASHAIGSKYLGQSVGNCTYSDITVFSFHPVKIITTGEGGLATTNDHELARRLAMLRSHGITRDDQFMTKPTEGTWYYQQIELGFNYRMTDMQAALGLSQLDRLEDFVAMRAKIAEQYTANLHGLPVMLPWQHPDTQSSWHLYVLRLIDDTQRNQVVVNLRAAGVLANVHYIPVHLQPFYRSMGFREGYCPESENYYAAAISIPLYPGMSGADQEFVVKTLRTAFE